MSRNPFADLPPIKCVARQPGKTVMVDTYSCRNKYDGVTFHGDVGLRELVAGFYFLYVYLYVYICNMCI